MFFKNDFLNDFSFLLNIFFFHLNRIIKSLIKSKFISTRLIIIILILLFLRYQILNYLV